jgi:hypothetical protein
LLWKSAAHLRHEDEPLDPWYRPLEQAVHDDEPLLEDRPRAQLMHDDEPLLEYRPLAQLSQSEEPL